MTNIRALKVMLGVSASLTIATVAFDAAAATRHYYYDPLGRLLGVTADTEEIQSFNFDTADNRARFREMLPAGPSASNVMNANQYLFRDQALWSSDGRYELTLQDDGNLVLYGPSGALWSSNTYLSAAAILAMQGDGNLVLYDPQWNALWSSGTSGNANADFTIQTDGNLVIYSTSGTALWNSGT